MATAINVQGLAAPGISKRCIGRNLIAVDHWPRILASRRSLHLSRGPENRGFSQGLQGHEVFVYPKRDKKAPVREREGEKKKKGQSIDY